MVQIDQWFMKEILNFIHDIWIVSFNSTTTKQTTFTIAVIVLSAKMAKADGTVTRDEVEAFKDIFHGAGCF